MLVCGLPETQQKKKIDSAMQDLGFKLDYLTRGIERACALHPEEVGHASSIR